MATVIERDAPVPDQVVSRRALRALVARRDLLAALEVFHTELGDVFRIPVPGFNPIMLVGPEANRFMLVEERNKLRWRSERDPLTQLLRHGVLVEDGQAHDSLRRQMNPAFHKRAIEGYAEAMWQCTDSVLATWQGAGEVVDMLVEVRKMALLILTRSLFGVDFAPEMDRLWQPILKALKFIAPGAWIFWRDVPRPGYKAALAELDAFLYRVIADRRVALAAGNEEENAVEAGDLVSLLIGAGMDDGLIRDQLVTMIIAGHDTSTALLSWCVYLLSREAPVQAQVYSELAGVFGQKAPTIAGASQLEYMEQVLQETMRLYPPIHLGSRIAARDLEFQGVAIPAGTRVLYSIYLVHRDPRHWRDPAIFDPARFSPDQARQRVPYTFVPFGGGPRNCIGMAFAQMEAKIVLARILQKFELELADTRVRVHMGATLEPRPGVMVRVRKRAP